MNASRPVMIAAGGTGGHVIPALSVARELQAHGVPVVWMGTRAGIESRLVPAAGIEIEWLEVAGLRGKGGLAKLLAPLRLLRACAQALSVLRRRKPRALLGMGGFASGPGGLMARLSGLPLVIHEQNAVAGLTNRLLSRQATRVLAAMPNAFADCDSEHVGNPVREDISALPTPAERFKGRNGPIRLLVLGGSQGAAALNRLLPHAVAQLDVDLVIRHQAGGSKLDAAREAYAEAGVDAEVLPFVEDMAGAYAWADLVVCRAGAMTVAELAAAGVASVLVPFPQAVDDHQTLNARYLADAGAARLAPEAQLDEARLTALLAELCADRAQLLDMAERAREQARIDAAARVAAVVLEVSE